MTEPMNHIPKSKFSLLHDPHATAILGISNKRISIIEAKAQGLEFFRDFNIPGWDSETLCYVAWCPNKVNTTYKTYLICCVGLPLHFQLIAHWEKQIFFVDLVRCKGRMT